MSEKTISTKIPRIALAALLLIGCGAVQAAGDQFDQPTVFSASKLLPADVVAGPNHKVRDEVFDDGYLFIYTVESKWGNLRAVSTATLHKRVHELNAMAAMEQLRGSEEFKEGIAEKAGDFVDGTAALLADPVGSVSGAVSGIGAMFRGAVDTLEHGRSETESGVLSDVTGFGKVRREYAAEFKVDVYSRNEYLQQELTDISKAGFVGSSIVRLGTMAVSGGAGAALSVTGTTEELSEAIALKSASLLRSENEDNLRAIGTTEDVIDLFLENRSYTMTQSTGIVLALTKMRSTDNRAAYIKFAVLTDNDDIAAFRQRQAQMYAAYHSNVEPIAAFEYLGRTATARTASDKIVFSLPLDHLLWTQDIGTLVANANEQIAKLLNVKGKELWISGTVSKRARENLEKLGWTLKERAHQS